MFKEVYAKVTVCKIVEKEWEERDIENVRFEMVVASFSLSVCLSQFGNKCEKFIFNLI